ncbi:MAG: hypothetical protein A2901_08805 [Elusimicrobia bacterium RIFCSPLOWO2_01_FULL_54_10]|nr:MAG: hypothetical protein A2901_08805 [Elusimicrobia bacterium RIFCSPLOWO2_01_FULL_54_10]
MDDKPGKGKIAAFVAVVVASAGLMSWALFESFRADQNQFDDFDESYYGEDFAEPELETTEVPAVTPAEPAKPAPKAKAATPLPAKEPAKP